MRIALLGGTGRIGSQLLSWALQSGYTVTALARDPAAITGLESGTNVTGAESPPSRAGDLIIIRGSATDPEAVAAVADGADAVLSALGPRGARTPDLLATAARNIVAAMDKTRVSRLICVSAAGPFIASDPDMGAVTKLVLPRVFAKAFADIRAMESIVSATDLDWTLVRPARLVTGQETGEYRVRPDYSPAGGRKISRADVAHFMEQTLAGGDWVRMKPALAY